MLAHLKRLWIKIRAFVGYIAAALAAGALSALLTSGSMAAFEALRKPSFAPPGWIFPAVWTVLFVLMGVSAALAARRGAGEARADALALWWAQLLVNFFWSLFFFRFEYRLFAFFWLLLLLGLVSLMIVRLFRISKTAAYLQIPYLLWLLFAACLNFSVWFLNR